MYEILWVYPYRSPCQGTRVVVLLEDVVLEDVVLEDVVPDSFTHLPSSWPYEFFDHKMRAEYLANHQITAILAVTAASVAYKVRNTWCESNDIKSTMVLIQTRKLSKFDQETVKDCSKRGACFTTFHYIFLHHPYQNVSVYRVTFRCFLVQQQA